MAYEALVLQVLVASPSDVEEERKTIPEVIYKWNAVHSDHEKIVLLPVKWETHSSSEYSGTDTQEVLNNQFVRNSDILIGAMWTKLGTPTVKNESGTVEEIEEFINSNKPVKLYFSTRGLPHDVQVDELTRMRNFKNSYKDKGIYKEYQSIVELRDLLFDDLTREIRRYKTRVLTERKEVVEEPKAILDISYKKKIMKILDTLLKENERIFLEYGPHSIRSKNLLSESSKIWREKCLDIIIPNNEKIVRLLKDNEHLISPEKTVILDKFITHTEGLKENYTSKFKDRNVPLFPKEVINIFD
jgi:hypothetical protein